MNDTTTIESRGIALRDYFAAQALQGLLVSPGGYYTCDSIAARAYEYADAMLKERDKAFAAMRLAEVLRDNHEEE
jgi:hypothetical protein